MSNARSSCRATGTRARAELPEGAEIFDAHTHLGDDIDGMRGRAARSSLGIMDAYGISRAFTFCMDEPDRHPAFRPRTTARSHGRRASDGRLIPFVRLDLAETPIEEAERSPRPRRARDQAPSARPGLPAQRRPARAGVRARRRAPRADPDPRRPRAAADRRRPRPARRALPGRELIIAHAGIADMAGLAEDFAGQAGRLLRHLGLEPGRPARLLPPGLAGAGPLRLRLPVRPAAELAPDRGPHGAGSRLLRGADARHARRQRRGASPTGEPPLEPTAPARIDMFSQPMIFARIHGYLSMATPLLWMRQPDTFGVLGLALNACEERNGGRGRGARARSAS